VSQFCAKKLPQLLEKNIRKNEGKIEGEKRPLEELIFFSIQSLVKQLACIGIDTRFSGTTCILCLVKGDLLYVTNIGDSRAIIGQLAKSKNFSL